MPPKKSPKKNVKNVEVGIENALDEDVPPKPSPPAILPSKPSPPATSPSFAISPTRPSGFAKRPDQSILSMGEMHDGKVATLRFEKSDGSAAYTKDFHDAVQSGGGNQLDLICVTQCKAKREDDSETATVGKKGAKLRVCVLFAEDEEDLKGKLSKAARKYEEKTKAFNTKARKPKARSGGISNAGNPSSIEEVLFKRDVAFVISYIFPKESFEDDEQAKAILGQYFCFTPVDEAKELVMAAYAADEET